MENKEIVANFIARFAQGDEELARLLAISVGRVVLRELNEGRLDYPDDETMRHISDWIAAAIAAEAHWLKKIDADGRPRKLMKFSTIAQISAEANKAMRAANSRMAFTVEFHDEEELHAELDDGYVLVRLLGPAALDRESSAMQHCIGNGAYDGHLKSGKRMYLSLRDRSGNPHATLEADVAAQQLIQLQGKQNRAPVRRYFEILRPYLERSGLAMKITASRLGYVIDRKGAWHALHELPDGLEIDGSLDISGCELTHLPRDMVITGDLVANDTFLRELPDGLTVGGDVRLARSQIRRLGNVPLINGDLNLSRSEIMFLPDHLRVRGSMDVSRSKIWRLPEGLNVGHSLNISDTDIEALPENMHIGVKLEMYRTRLETLPDCLDDELVVYHGRGKAHLGRGGMDGCLAEDMKVRQKRSLLRQLVGPS